MNLKQHILRRRIRRNGSWSTIIGLMTACAATLIGVLVGLEPDIILWRSLASGMLMSFLVSFGMSVIYVANAPG